MMNFTLKWEKWGSKLKHETFSDIPKSSWTEYKTVKYSLVLEIERFFNNFNLGILAPPNQNNYSDVRNMYAVNVLQQCKIWI